MTFFCCLLSCTFNKHRGLPAFVHNVLRISKYWKILNKKAAPDKLNLSQWNSKAEQVQKVSFEKNAL